MLQYLLLGFLCTTVVALFYRISLARQKASLPGPKSYPLLGNLELVLKRNDILDYFHKYSKLYPDIYETWFGPQRILVLNGCDVIQTVLNTTQLMDKPIFYTGSDLKYGLITATYPIWRIHRKSLNSTFNLRILEKYVPVFDRKSEILVKRLTQHLDREEFDILDLVGKCTLESVCATTMCMDPKSDVDVEKTLSAFQRYLEEVAFRISNFHMHVTMIYKRTKNCHSYKKVRSHLTRVIENMICHRRKAIEESDPADDTDHFKPKILIDQMIQISMDKSANHRFSSSEIRDESFTMVVAGSETSALTVAFTVLMLAMHTDVQEKVFEEIHIVDATHSAPLSMEALKSYTFLEQVVKESLRLFPVFPLAGRQAMADVNIGPCVVTPNICVLIDIFSLHRRKDIWGADADAFDPTRFAPEQMEGKHPYCFIPFSAGPRNCIGSRYAMLKIKVILINLLRHYKFATDLRFDELKLNYLVSLRLHNRHMVKISRR